MQRGTALKLIELLKSGKYKLGKGQLRYGDYFCTLGVLLDFIDPTKWERSYDGVSYTWEGELHKVPESVMKRCKMKSPYGAFITDNGARTDLADITDISSDWDFPIYYIEHFYQQM